MDSNRGSSDLASELPQRSAKFGPVDASDALTEVRTESRMNTSSTGTFRFDFSSSVEVPDYFGELYVAMSYQGKSWPIFTGSVTEAVPSADGVTVHAAGTQQLHENIVTDMVAQGVTPPEMIYVLARSSGIRQERLKIEGIESLSRETFEVIAPVDGITTHQITEFAGVEFLPADNVITGDLEISDVQRAAFTALAYARTSVTASMMLEAEEKGLAAIDLALAWLTAHLRCGAAMLPHGKPLPFDRQESLAKPSRRELVTVRGTTSGRHWLRRPSMASQERSVHLTGSIRPLAGTLRSLTLQEQQALLALGRAAREPDLLAQVHSLWEAIEFYCSGISVNHLFTTEQLKAITNSLPELEPDQRRRAMELIGQLNSPPLNDSVQKGNSR